MPSCSTMWHTQPPASQMGWLSKPQIPRLFYCALNRIFSSLIKNTHYSIQTGVGPMEFGLYQTSSFVWPAKTLYDFLIVQNASRQAHTHTHTYNIQYVYVVVCRMTHLIKAPLIWLRHILLNHYRALPTEIGRFWQASNTFWAHFHANASYSVCMCVCVCVCVQLLYIADKTV